jgi:hypothetical protein
MKRTLTVLIFLATAIVASAATNKKTDAAKTAPQAITIPKDAVPNADGNSYTWKDKQGKKWVFAKTPFGIMKTPVSDAAATATAPDSLTKAIDKGDTVRFERPGPFGTISWEKKKADLTDDERHTLDAQNAKPQ